MHLTVSSFAVANDRSRFLSNHSALSFCSKKTQSRVEEAVLTVLF
jgi:hypothetical protein